MQIKKASCKIKSASCKIKSASWKLKVRVAKVKVRVANKYWENLIYLKTAKGFVSENWTIHLN